MKTAKLFGNGLLSLSLVCWMVGCQPEEEVTPTTMPTTGAPSPGVTPPSGSGEEGEGHEHAEGEEGHEHAEGEEGHEHAEGEEGHDHAEEGTEGEATEGEATEGDAQSSTDALEVPESTADATESTLEAPVVEAGSST